MPVPHHSLVRDHGPAALLTNSGRYAWLYTMQAEKYQ